MTNRDCALLAFRLFGLWYASSALWGAANLPYYWETAGDEIRGKTIAFILLPLVVMAATGVGVWLNADGLASHIFPESAGERLTPDRFRGERLFALSLAIIGMAMVCEAVPTVVHGGVLFFQSRREGILGPDPDRQRLL